VTGYDALIPPEVSQDSFHSFIEAQARRKDVQTILEIGSSSGEGSTSAFVSGMKLNPNRPILYCIELSKIRFDALKKRYEANDQVRCYNVSTVSADNFPSEAEVALFYRRFATNLNRYPLHEVLKWRRQDLDYLRTCGLPTDGIGLIKRENGINQFDLVLIDGSAFTGPTELDQVYGAGIILLDDVNDIKNMESYRRLLSDPHYALITENWKIRNGYAAFGRRDTQRSWLLRSFPFLSRVRLPGNPAKS